MHPETHLVLHSARATKLRAEADAYHLATVARRHRDLRARLGWALVEAGLRLTAASGTTVAVPISRVVAPSLVPADVPDPARAGAERESGRREGLRRLSRSLPAGAWLVAPTVEIGGYEAES